MTKKSATKKHSTASAKKTANASEKAKPSGKPSKVTTKPTTAKSMRAKPSKAAKVDDSASIAPASAAPGTSSALADELAPLAKMGKTELWKLFEKVFGHKTASCNTTYLRTAIAKELTARGSAVAVLGATAVPTTAATAPKTTRAEGGSTTKNGERDPRMPAAGTILERTHHGVVHKVKVLDDGFEYKGAKHASLSGLAKLITGAVWNGWAWFGLVPRAVKKTTAAASALRIAHAVTMATTKTNTRGAAVRRG